MQVLETVAAGLAPFHVFGSAVAEQFNKMSTLDLFRTGATKDQLWEVYLTSYPAGTNPIFRSRTEHDCQCCRQFIRAIGNVVAIKDGELVSIWDINVGGHFQVVADAMAALVKGQPIVDEFLSPEPTAGTERSREITASGDVHTWNHFFVRLPASATCVRKDQIPTALSETRSTKDVFLRGLKEITIDALDTVIELISQNSLLRGQENLPAVVSFRALKGKFDTVVAVSNADIFVWSVLKGVNGGIARIRNTAIGTLLQDLSEGRELVDSVASFEDKVNGSKYKRPTALVTKAMVQKAQATLEELGFVSALERRYATIEDITVNDILFANRDAKKAMSVFDDITSAIPEKAKNLDRVEEITIEAFLANVLPKAESVEVLFENRHSSNLVSLISPVDPEAKGMFKWGNNFSWSYTGDVADSIKERVKRAGGSVVGDLCCRLAWDYTDDLDFHMIEPNGYRIFYGNRYQESPSKGRLDVDANGGSGMMDEPVENIFYGSKSNMAEGFYTLKVNNYSRRSSGVGFTVEIEFAGQILTFAYDRVIPNNATVEVAQIKYSKKDGFSIVKSLPSTKASKKVWNVDSETFQKVTVAMLSPNYWEGNAVGNKHYFFMLEGCQNEGTARGFYNEFLNQELDKHRKVLEMVGAKMRTDNTDRQLSGLGFSSTQRNHLLARVKGSFTRTVKITF